MDKRKALRTICTMVPTLGAAGCFADVGPQVGVSIRDGRPRLGWELGAETLSVGQTYRLGGASEGVRSAPPPPSETPEPNAGGPPRSPDVRTYLVWEPRIGGSYPSADGAGGFGLFGGGITAGIQWDTVVQAALDGTSRAHTDFGGVFGVFGGASYVPSNPSYDCKADVRPFYSIALGVRGDEIYLSPKVGVVDLPHLCLNLGNL